MSFTIMSPFENKPLEKCPDGTSLKGMTFETREDAFKFLQEHGSNPIEMRDTDS